MAEYENDFVDDQNGMEEALDPAVAKAIEKHVQELASGEQEVRHQARASLLEIGEPAIDRLMFMMTDTRLPLADRSRAGTVLGLLGDPRLQPPEGLATVYRVTSGDFTMGSKPFEPEAATNAQPEHVVDLASYNISRFPVTNQAFAAFVEGGGYTNESWWSDDGRQWLSIAGVDAPHYWKGAADKPNHPVAGVNWFEAWAYCNWLTERLTESGDLRPGENARLPTEAEWEKAARGGVTLDRRRSQPNNMPERHFPWGDAFLPEVANTAEGGLGGTSPVGMFQEGESPYKVADLGGNVLEWCNSKPGPYPYHAGDGREDQTGGSRAYRISRGGSWAFGADSARCAYRHWNRADFRGGMIGFRVVVGYKLG